MEREVVDKEQGVLLIEEGQSIWTKGRNRDFLGEGRWQDIAEAGSTKPSLRGYDFWVLP